MLREIFFCIGNLKTKMLQKTKRRGTVRILKGKSCYESVINSWFHQSGIKHDLFGEDCEMAVVFGSWGQVAP